MAGNTVWSYMYVCMYLFAKTHDKTIKADSVAWLPGRQSALTEATKNIWYVISRSGVVISITNCYIRVYFTLQQQRQIGKRTNKKNIKNMRKQG